MGKGQLPSIFLAYTPWQLEVNYIGRMVSIINPLLGSHPVSSPVPVLTSLAPTTPDYLTLGHVIFRIRTIIHL